ncbi:hypothetical protein GDO81_026893 [Engystomops pustulosus]|uniref:Uncharacterized protein n=1 Tax=Engystomops pustulosus TaxID=76066 RepID=A0AAV6ZP65_ENGPU|nr:hypothetical protein GDO81_026893 [Engystomops pustulosus]
MVDGGRLGLSGSCFPGEFPPLQNAGSSPSLKKFTNCNRHEPIPDIILTAVDSPPCFSKEITTPPCLRFPALRWNALWSG